MELTQEGPAGIRFDFNDGCRLSLPDGKWDVRLRDLDTGNIIYQTSIGAGRVASRKHYYIRFRIEVRSDDDLVFSHDYDAAGRDVLIEFAVNSLGDTIGWFSYAARFAQKHRCRLTCAVPPPLVPLFRDTYPDINVVPHTEALTQTFYATYRPVLYFNDTQYSYQPVDYQLVGFHRNAAYILGVDPAEEPPRIAIPDAPRPIAEPYVCIATQATAQCKYWNNPQGWGQVIDFLKRAGYRVICIDQKKLEGGGLIWNHIPHGAEDQTGDRPLQERTIWLRHAAFFVGLSSGLSWLAWAVGTPVVMISGFTHPITEFATPYRVINYHACNSCFNDVRLEYDRSDRMRCPRHAGTDRQFECSRLITASHVEQTIARIPGFGRQT